MSRESMVTTTLSYRASGITAFCLATLWGSAQLRAAYWHAIVYVWLPVFLAKLGGLIVCVKCATMFSE